MLRNGEQLLLAVVIPVIVLVGGVPGAAPDRHRPSTHRAVDVLHARRARAGRDVDVVHLAGDRDRLRAPLRRASSGSAPRRSPAPACCWARSARCSLVEVLQVLVISAVGVRARLGAASPPAAGRRRWRVVLGTAAFASLGLFVAGVLRAEATLAAANLVYLLLMAGGAVVLPARRRTAPSATSCSWLPSGALGDAMRDALIDGAHRLASTSRVLLGWAVVGTVLTARTFTWE